MGVLVLAEMGHRLGGLRRFLLQGAFAGPVRSMIYREVPGRAKARWIPCRVRRRAPHFKAGGTAA
jgi:hypothetical protein